MKMSHLFALTMPVSKNPQAECDPEYHFWITEPIFIQLEVQFEENSVHIVVDSSPHMFPSTLCRYKISFMYYILFMES